MPRKKNAAFPVRFKNYGELTEREKDARFHKYHFENLKGKDLKPLLRDKFRPVLKANGFNRVSDSLSIRIVEPHYIHCLQIHFSSLSQGRFYVRAGIALNMLPLSDWSEFNPKRLNVDADCLFTKDLTLPNGNPAFDNGTNLTEAEETIRYLTACFTDFDRVYFGQFANFPAPIDSLGVEFVERLTMLMRDNLESEYGSCGATIELFTLRLALLHGLLGNAPESRKLAEYGLANYELYDLKNKYELLTESNL